jgi:hypothetical protein
MLATILLRDRGVGFKFRFAVFWKIVASLKDRNI